MENKRKDVKGISKEADSIENTGKKGLKQPRKQLGPLGLKITYACVIAFLGYSIYMIIKSPGEFGAWIKSEILGPIIGLITNTLQMLGNIFS